MKQITKAVEYAMYSSNVGKVLVQRYPSNVWIIRSYSVEGEVVLTDRVTDNSTTEEMLDDIVKEDKDDIVIVEKDGGVEEVELKMNSKEKKDLKSLVKSLLPTNWDAHTKDLILSSIPFTNITEYEITSYHFQSNPKKKLIYNLWLIDKDGEYYLGQPIPPKSVLNSRILDNYGLKERNK